MAPAASIIPTKAKTNCAGATCRSKRRNDFGARFFRAAEHADQLSVHNHLFPAANTGLAAFSRRSEAMAAEQEFLKGMMRVDLFGLQARRRDRRSTCTAPLRPDAAAA